MSRSSAQIVAAFDALSENTPSSPRWELELGLGDGLADAERALLSWLVGLPAQPSLVQAVSDALSEDAGCLLEESSTPATAAALFVDALAEEARDFANQSLPRRALVVDEDLAACIAEVRLFSAALDAAGFDWARRWPAPPRALLNAEPREVVALDFSPLAPPGGAGRDNRPPSPGFVYLGEELGAQVLNYVRPHPRLRSSLPVSAVAARLRLLADRRWESSGGSDDEGVTKKLDLRQMAADVENLRPGGIVRTSGYRMCGLFFVFSPFPDAPRDLVLVQTMTEYGYTLPPEAACVMADGELRVNGSGDDGVLVDPTRMQVGAGGRGLALADLVARGVELRRRSPRYVSHNDWDYGPQEVDPATFPQGYLAKVGGSQVRDISWAKTAAALDDHMAMAMVRHAELFDRLHDELRRRTRAAVGELPFLPDVVSDLVTDYVVSPCRLVEHEVPATFRADEEAVSGLLEAAFGRAVQVGNQAHMGWHAIEVANAAAQLQNEPEDALGALLQAQLQDDEGEDD